MRQEFLFVWAVAAVSSAQAASFFAIGPDPTTFGPDQLMSVTLAPPAVNTVATLGDGSLGFNGGLTEGPGGVLYAIANDSSGAGSLYTAAADGTLTLVGTAGGLGFGFLGGLAYDPANSTFYAAVNDSGGNATLYSITSGGVAASTGIGLGTDFSGLAYDAASSLFYGIGNDNSGFSTLYDFSLAGPVNSVAGLGFGFGALTYDAANDVLWAIDPVNNAGSQLFQITGGGSVSAPLLALGDGFSELAVVSGSTGTQTPEPSTPAAIGGGLVLLSCVLRRRK